MLTCTPTRALQPPHPQSTTGTESANWLYGVVRDIAANRSDITVEQYVHTNFNQRSLITCFAGSQPDLPMVIIGAHQDSINSQNPSGGRSPGADDDGSGSITLLEAFRVLIANNFYPVRPYVSCPIRLSPRAGQRGS